MRETLLSLATVAMSLLLPLTAQAADCVDGINTANCSVPADASSVRIEAWGAGAGGGSGDGGGGGGGSYCAASFAVTPGDSLVLAVGAGGWNFSGLMGKGGNTSVTGPGITGLTANGGGASTSSGPGGPGGGGAGGTDAGCTATGATKFAGGNGANGSGTTHFDGFGGGGGGSATSSASGGHAVGTSGGTGQGSGGNAGTNVGASTTGAVPGGGGGGGSGLSVGNGGGSYGANGQVKLTFTRAPATGAASGITATGATLAGRVSDNGATTSVSFDYGLTTAYGTNVAATPATIAIGDGSTVVSSALTGLSCNTTYHFRVRAFDGASTTYGSDAPFTTTACAPIVSNVSPTTGHITGGTSVVITGTHLTGTTAVSFGGSAAGSFTVDSATQVTATTPAHAAGAVDVVITTAGGNGTGVGVFSYVDMAPVLTSVGVSGTTVSGTTLAATSNKAATGYWMVVVRGATAPTSAQVKTPASYGGATVTSGSAPMVAAVGKNFSVAALSAHSSYDLYLVAEDTGNNLVATPTLVQFTTLAAGACGAANGQAAAWAPATAALCTTGTPSSVSAGAGWTWTCTAGSVAACAAPYPTTSTHTGGAHLGITASSGGVPWSGGSASFVSVASTNTPGPVGFTLRHGLVDFTLTGGTARSSATVAITFPSALPADTVWWKYGPTASNPTAHWYPYPASIAGNVVTLTLTDNADGDDDYTIDSQIRDPGGPGEPVGGASTSVPTLSAWGMVILSSLMALFGFGKVRRRASANHR